VHGHKLRDKILVSDKQYLAVIFLVHPDAAEKNRNKKFFGVQYQKTDNSKEKQKCTAYDNFFKKEDKRRYDGKSQNLNKGKLYKKLASGPETCPLGKGIAVKQF
jgi:hypothetical protein